MELCSSCMKMHEQQKFIRFAYNTHDRQMIESKRKNVPNAQMCDFFKKVACSMPSDTVKSHSHTIQGIIKVTSN